MKQPIQCIKHHWGILLLLGLIYLLILLCSETKISDGNNDKEMYGSFPGTEIGNPGSVKIAGTEIGNTALAKRNHDSIFSSPCAMQQLALNSQGVKANSENSGLDDFNVMHYMKLLP
jgi:hypothetical protein